MTEEEFLKQMEDWNVRPGFYNINGPLKDFSYNLLKVSADEYVLFYLEKGEIDDRQIFFTYEEALDYLSRRIKEVYDIL